MAKLDDLIVEISVKASGVDQATRSIANGMRSAGRAIENAQRTANSSLTEMRREMSGVGDAADGMARSIRNSVGGTSVRSLIREYAELETRIERQRSLLNSLYAEVDRLGAEKDEMDNLFGSISEPSERLLELQEATSNAGRELRNMESESAALAQQITAAAQAQERATEATAAQRQQTEALRGGFDNVAFALQSVSMASDGVLSSLSSAASQVRFLKQGYLQMAQAGSRGMALFSTGLAGTMIALNLVSSLLQKIKAEREEAFRVAKENAESFDISGKDISNAQRYIGILQARKATTEQVQEATSGLAELFPEMIQGYDAEGNAILGTVGQMQEYIKALERTNELKTQQNAAGFDSLLAGLRDAAASYQDELARAISTAGGMDAINELGEEQKQAFLQKLDESTAKAKLAIDENLEGVKSAAMAKLQSIFGAEDAAVFQPVLEQMTNQMWEQMAAAAKSGNTAQLGQIQKSFESRINKALGNMRSFKKVADSMGTKLSSTLNTTLKAAIANSGRDIDAGEMQKIVERALAIDTKSQFKSADKQLTAFKEMLISNLSLEDLDPTETAAKVDAIMAQLSQMDGFADAVASGDTTKIANFVYATFDNALAAAAQRGSAAYMEAISWVTKIISAMQAMSAVGISTPKIKTGGGGGRRKSGGGGRKSSSAYKNQALEDELNLLEHRKAMDTLTYQEEIKQLQRIKQQHAKTVSEIWDLEERLHDARVSMSEEAIAHDKAMDRLTLQEEINRQRSLLNLYGAGTAERRAVEEEVYDLQKQLRRQEYDLKVYYGKLTLAQQESFLKKEIANYKAGTQARIDLEKELYDVQQQLRQQRVDLVDNLIGGLTEALQNRYDEQQQAETDRINQSIESWQTWADEQTKAIQAQIDALDEQQDAEDKAEQERQKRRKVAALQQQLDYEQDAYNRKKLAEQLAKAQDELNTWLRKNEIDAQKKALQAEMDAAQSKAEEEQKRLEEEQKTIDKAFEERKKQQNLEAEAQRILMKNSQQEILDLLKDYASDYNLTGQTLGEQLLDGFMAKAKNIDGWFKDFTQYFTDYQKQLAQIAADSAEAFYANMGLSGNSTGPGTPQSQSIGVPQVTLNITNPKQSPAELKRMLVDVLEQVYQMN